jgi:hypothetical protein
MGFNLFFAGWGSKEADRYLRDTNKLRLLSYVNERNLLESWIEEQHSGRLFVDSGAYTVAHSGANVDLDGYIEYINNHPDIKIWAELDVIPYPTLNPKTAVECSENSWKNYLYMRERINTDCRILPVFHFGEPEDALYRILNTPVNGKLSDYVCIGGRHGVSTVEQIAYFNRIWKIIRSSDNPKVRVHALGITVPEILERFPFYSADSTTWLQVAINGGILTRDLDTITISNNQTSLIKHIDNRPSEAKEFIQTEVAKLGYTLEELCEDYKARLIYNIDVMQQWADNYVLRERSGEYETLELF